MKHKRTLILATLIPVLIFTGVFVFLQCKVLLSKNLFNSSSQLQQEVPTNNSVNTEKNIPEDASVEFAKNFLVSDKAISKINTKSKIVVFTFDVESKANSLDSVLKVLEKYKVTTAFFVTGKFADWYPADVKSINNAGNEIYSHTYSHPHLTSLSDAQIKDELTKADTSISTVTGKTVKPFYRPPFDATNNHIRQLAATLGYQEVTWSIDALDLQESSGMTASAVKSRIYSNLVPGEIYLMHLSDNITGQVLDEVFKYITEHGYTIANLRTALTYYQNK